MKEKIIEVNKCCEINKDNIAIVRDRKIGINILRLNDFVDTDKMGRHIINSIV